MSTVSTPNNEIPILIQDGAEAPRGRTARSAHIRWLLHRLTVAAASLILLSIVVFGATQVLPGNAAVQLLGRNTSPQNVKIAEKQLGLDKSVVTQYVTWAGNIVTGDLGRSLTSSREKVSTLLRPAIVNSAVLVLASLFISLALALAWGIWSAVRPGRISTGFFYVVSFIFNSIPEFVIGLALVMVFATSVFRVLPAVSIIPAGTSPLANIEAFILPVACLVITVTGYLARLIRASMLEELNSDYVRLARLKGISKRRVIYCHALPNALVPTIQGVAVVFGYLAGGIVVVEFVFGFPGIGTALLSAIQTRDVPVVQAAGLILGAVYVIVNLLADLLVYRLSPRLWTATS